MVESIPAPLHGFVAENDEVIPHFPKIEFKILTAITSYMSESPFFAYLG